MGLVASESLLVECRTEQRGARPMPINSGARRCGTVWIETEKDPGRASHTNGPTPGGFGLALRRAVAGVSRLDREACQEVESAAQ